VDYLQLASFGNLGSHSAIIHRTVRYANGAMANCANSRLQKSTVNSATARTSQSRRQKAHWTVNWTYPVHHRTVRWSHLSELQRSNPNGWVTWLAHQTVSGGAPDSVCGAPDCLVRPSTAAPPNDNFGGWGYKYPQPQHFKASKFSDIPTNTRASAFNTRHKYSKSKSLQSPNSTQSISD
jgi:hypothetical protein